MAKIRPNFLIVGAAKSGTTSLYHYLKQHPDVFVPDWKEPAFFAPPEAGGVTREEEYYALFKSAKQEKAIGEASVSYLYAPNVPQKIYGFLGPNTKIIILLRNPVDMAYSLWGHQVREGYEDLTFEEALTQEAHRIEHPDFAQKRHSWIYNYAYTQRARYAAQIARYDAVFAKNQIKILLFEEFFVQNLPFFGDICRFLEIDDGFKPLETKHNLAGQVKHKALREVLRRKMIWKDMLKTLIPKPLRMSMRERLERYNRIDQPLAPLDPGTQKALENVFKPDIEALEKRLKRPLNNIWF